ncbi:hypothetical protein SMACR_03710 [Sordaria macrospora]|uniref:WGS project CABT00000000 data, contig 2.9 n=2 Tax=Sordaria macrospora TaxID=5147 RepID=F7VVY6_SORMK|nr:uncharacterized protein SMAC_03710 [Sordaria macrospora k-hell]KAA8635075.1 hypothetical protein SMACR_03710 [Sordaria macrospora]KAH7625675.1 hypothetical protein B0T09DRAFT_350819 [Sordaria sp. MPI-SDFR-AT-0083]WPJ66106.1 hypothetical protein SMAC4_03710 [Sordaria macrospora]CCC09677.1 unnamed protein product [Sordaria macrospora k-hell]
MRSMVPIQRPAAVRSISGVAALAGLTATSTSTRPQPPFHLIASHSQPRRCTLFTSNGLLAQNGNNNEPSRQPSTSPSTTTQKQPSSAADDATTSQQQNKSSAVQKRKLPLKNSLHRVAIVAQKGSPAKSAPVPIPEHTIEPDGRSTISAVCVAESFDMDAVASLLTSHNFSLDPDNTGFDIHEVVHARGLTNHGDIFVFPSGTIVTWALPADVVDTLATRLLIPAAEIPFVENKEEEDLEFATDPSEEQSKVQGDVVVLGTLREVSAGDKLDTTLAKIAFSSGLARSTKLAVLESSLTRYLESTRHIPDRLSQGLKAPLSRELILRKTGELLNLRSQLNHYNDLTDALPDIFWDSEEKLETYYSKIGKALDVGVRIKTLNDKMTYAQEVVKVAQEVLDISEKMSSEKHSTRLEWIIIILIAIEVVFELRRLWMERFETHDDDVLRELKRIGDSLEALRGDGGGKAEGLPK